MHILVIVFITSFRETEGQVYKALVKEKEEAQNEYNKAVSTGRTAGLVSNRLVEFDMIAST